MALKVDCSDHQPPLLAAYDNHIKDENLNKKSCFFEAEKIGLSLYPENLNITEEEADLSSFVQLLNKIGVPEELQPMILAKNRKNKKLLRNLHMLDGLALCFDPDDTEPPTFLDKMNLNDLTARN